MRPHLSRRAGAALSLTLTAGLVTAALGAPAASAAPAGEPVINEFSIDTVGVDTEYVELLGPVGWDPTDYRVLEIEGDSGTSIGSVDEVITIPAPDADGRVLVDLAANTLENGTVTLLLVEGFTGAAGNDLDTDNDGALDATPWSLRVDDVAVHDGGASDSTYGAVTLGVAYDGQPFKPGGASRIPDGADTDAAADWVRNDFDLAGIPGNEGTLTETEAANTPGEENSRTLPDPGVQVSVTAPAPTATEGGSAGSFQVARTGPTEAALEVSLTVGGTASAGDWSSEPALAATVTIPAGSASRDIAVTAVDDTEAEGPETLSLTVTDGDGYGVGSPDSATLTIADDDAPACFATDTPIGTVQGSGDASPLADTEVTVQGTVVADHEHNAGLRGFYLQDAGDGDASTSDGIFVYQGSDTDQVDLGDVVQVTGTVAEYQGQTQIDQGSVVEDCGVTGTVTPTVASLPLSAPSDLERFEGMLLTFTQELTVTEHFQLGRFGQVVVSSGGRLPQPTSVAAPGAEALAVQAANDLNRLVVDDDLQTQNPDPIALARGGDPLTADNTLRGGDTVVGLTGVLTYTWGGNGASPNAYRLRPLRALGGSADFQAGNPRPTGSPEVGGSLRVSAFNVLNYFVTLGGTCGPDNNLDCRGADSATELERQRTKLLRAVVGLDADVLGLVELENSTGADPLDGPDGLVTGLNEATAPGTYAGIDTGVVGTDAIRVGLVYQPATVAPVGGFEVVDASDDARFRDDFNRPVLVQTFEEVATGERFTVAVNHLKSKGSDCESVDDPDLGDGQGNCNETRRLAAAATVDVLDQMVTDGTADEDLLVLGDLNAYAQEDPVRMFEEAGYVNLVEEFGGTEAYSYAFDGQWGYLDHALASSALRDGVTGAAEWHINADEPGVLDYNTEFKSVAQVDSLYAPDEFRTSDHDPVVVGLDLAGGPDVELLGDAGRCRRDDTVTLRVRVGDAATSAEDLLVTATGSGRAVDSGSVRVSGDGEVRTVTLGVVSRKRVTRGQVEVTVSDGRNVTTLQVGVRSGTNGKDRLVAGDGRPWVLVGGKGADRLIGGEQADLLCGAGGGDVLKGGHGDDALVGGRGPDVLKGGRGDDTLLGGQGADVLRGGPGADLYDGGKGRDELLGVDHDVDHVRWD